MCFCFHLQENTSGVNRSQVTSCHNQRHRVVRQDRGQSLLTQWLLPQVSSPLLSHPQSHRQRSLLLQPWLHFRLWLHLRPWLHLLRAIRRQEQSAQPPQHQTAFLHSPLCWLGARPNTEPRGPTQQGPAERHGQSQQAPTQRRGPILQTHQGPPPPQEGPAALPRKGLPLPYPLHSRTNQRCPFTWKEAMPSSAATPTLAGCGEMPPFSCAPPSPTPLPQRQREASGDASQADGLRP